VPLGGAAQRVASVPPASAPVGSAPVALPGRAGVDLAACGAWVVPHSLYQPH
jgi:hypothetical protein